MKRFILFCLTVIAVNQLLAQTTGFNPPLDSIFLDYANKYNEDIYVVNVTRLGGVDFYSIRNEPYYDKRVVDKFFFYKKSLVLYTATDSLDRSEYLNSDVCFNFKDTIIGYPSEFDGFFDPMSPCLFFTPISPHKFIRAEYYTDNPNYKFEKAEDDRGIRWQALNKVLNEFINNFNRLIYEIRFGKVGKNIYVSLSAGSYYDKSKIDYYFYRNGHLVTLYFTDFVKDMNILDYNYITKFTSNIPKIRSIIRKGGEWGVPPPLRYLILKDKSGMRLKKYRPTNVYLSY